METWCTSPRISFIIFLGPTSRWRSVSLGSMYNPLIHSICAHFSIIIFSVFQKMQSVHQQGLFHCRFPHWHSHAANCYTSANVNKVPGIRVCDREHLGQCWEDLTTNNCYLDMSHSNGGSLFFWYQLYFEYISILQQYGKCFQPSIEVW